VADAKEYERRTSIITKCLVALAPQRLKQEAALQKVDTEQKALWTVETVETTADLRANLENAQTMLTDVQRRIQATLEAAKP